MDDYEGGWRPSKSGFKAGDRVHVEGEEPWLKKPVGPATVVSTYARRSDAWSPFCEGVCVLMDGETDPNQTHEFFIGYDKVRKLEG